jgi:hypothetical protein
MIRLQSLDNADHAFAQYLTARDWQETRSSGASQQFYNSDGQLIACAEYSNSESTYQVWGAKS